ncbi:hypothetical protein B0H13DRAFT_2346518 [Mycena leptocephala]|nr:hypothetical protein B0H13DRAFT_2346518 [Mycena leptocephala]
MSPYSVVVFTSFIGHDEYIAVTSKILIDCVPVIIALFFSAFARDAVQKLASETDVDEVLLQSREVAMSEIMISLNQVSFSIPTSYCAVTEVSPSATGQYNVKGPDDTAASGTSTTYRYAMVPLSPDVFGCATSFTLIFIFLVPPLPLLRPPPLPLPLPLILIRSEICSDPGWSSTQ